MCGCRLDVQGKIPDEGGAACHGHEGKAGESLPQGPLGFPVRWTGRGSALKGGHGACPARVRRGAGRRRAGRMARRAWAAWLLPIPHAAGRHRRHGEPVGAARGRVPDRLAGGLSGHGRHGMRRKASRVQRSGRRRGGGCPAGPGVVVPARSRRLGPPRGARTPAPLARHAQAAWPGHPGARKPLRSPARACPGAVRALCRRRHQQEPRAGVPGWLSILQG